MGSPFLAYGPQRRGDGKISIRMFSMVVK